MPRQDPPVPTSYEEIVRKTVPDPDTSQRPTERQEQLAHEGFRQMDEHESALVARVQSELAGEPAVDIEVDRETVTLRGQVADAQTITRIEDRVSRVAGVSSVHNRLVVG